MMGWEQGWGGMMGGGWFMWLSLLLLIGLTVWVVSVWSTGTGRSESFGATRETPLEILQKRYARGEISRDEYEQMRRDLQASP